MKPILFGIAAGCAFQAWRLYPADGPQTTAAAMLVSALACVVSFLVGRGYRRPAGSVAVAMASAEATATATNTVNVALVVPGAGAGRSQGQIPDESVSWFGGESSRSVEAMSDGFDTRDLRDLLGEEVADHAE